MENEIEDIKQTLDLLIARSLAQEALLLHLARHSEESPWWLKFQSDQTREKLKTQLVRTGLTDVQLALVESEFQRLHRLLTTLPPADVGPF